MYVCPICHSRNVTVYGDQHTAKCTNCGTFDALRRFEAAIVKTGNEVVDPLAIFPPQEVIDAANVLRNYFERDRACKQWAFMHVQSREEPALVGIEHVRNMAQAFQMELVTVPPYLDFIARMREILKAAQAGASEQNVPLDEVAPFVVNEVSAYLFPTRL